MMRRPVVVLTVVLAVLASSCGFIADRLSDDPILVSAVVPRAANVFVGSEVRVLGLQVGEVAEIQPRGDHVEITLSLDPSRDYPADVNVRLKPISLLGERMVQLDPPYTGGPTLQSGAEIPAERTGIPAEVDEVLQSFEDFLGSLDAGALAELVDVLADTLEGNGEGLNDLTASGAETIRVLADSSVDLNQVVRELATLNETLATREERIGSTLNNTSTVLRNLQEDRELLIGAITELTRAVTELEPLILKHDDPLVRDLEILTTTLSTVDRNLERFGETFTGAQRLFTTAGRVIEYENARLPLDNEFGFLAPFIADRVANRVVGLCARLNLPDCSQLEDVLDQLPPLCIPGLCAVDGDPTTGPPALPLPEGLGQLFAGMAPETRAAIASELQTQQQEHAATPEPPAPPAGLPAVDPRLQGRGSTPDPPPAPAVPGFSGGDH